MPSPGVVAEDGEEEEPDGSRGLPTPHPETLLEPLQNLLPGSPSHVQAQHHEVVGSPAADALLRGNPASFRKLERKSRFFL